MELAEEYFVLPHIEMKGLSKSTLQTVVKLPVLRNISAIEKDEILVMSHETDEDDEE